MEGLTANELKEHLYKRFEKKGLIDDMKAGLRNHLLTELSRVTPYIDKPEKELNALPATVSNWLVFNHLQKYGFEWTVSTFKAEIESKIKYGANGLSLESMSSKDVVQILNFNCDELNLNNGVLYEMITGICKKRLSIKLVVNNAARCECKTDNDENTITNQTSDVKFHFINTRFGSRNSLCELYDEFIENQLNDAISDVLKNSQPLTFTENKIQNSNIEAYNRLIKNSLKKAVSVSLENVRKIQSEVINAEKEAQNSGYELYSRLDSKNILESNFQLKKWEEIIRNRVTSIYDDLHQRKLYCEGEILNQRQQILNDIDNIKHKEIELRQKRAEFDVECRNKEDELERRFDKLKKMEDHCSHMSKNIENIIFSRVDKYKKEFQEELSSRVQNINKQEQEIKTEFIRLEGCKKDIENLYQKVVPSPRSNFDLESKFMEESQKIKNQLSEISDQQQKIQNGWENQQLKTECDILKQQLSSFRSQMSAMHNAEKQELSVSDVNTRTKSKITEPILALKKDIEKLKQQKYEVKHTLNDEIKSLKMQVSSQEEELLKTKQLQEREEGKYLKLASRLYQVKDSVDQTSLHTHSLANGLKQAEVSHSIQESYSQFPQYDITYSDLNCLAEQQKFKPIIDDNFINQTKLRIKALELETNNVTKFYNTIQKEKLNPVKPFIPLSWEQQFKQVKEFDQDVHERTKAIIVKDNGDLINQFNKTKTVAIGDPKFNSDSMDKNVISQEEKISEQKKNARRVQRALFTNEQNVASSNKFTQNISDFQKCDSPESLHETSTPKHENSFQDKPNINLTPVSNVKKIIKDDQVKISVPFEDKKHSAVIVTHQKHNINDFESDQVVISSRNDEDLTPVLLPKQSEEVISEIAPAVSKENQTMINTDDQVLSTIQNFILPKQTDIEKDLGDNSKISYSLQNLSDGTQTLSSIHISSGNLSAVLPSKNSEDEFSW